MNYEIELAMATLQVKQRRGLDYYSDYRALAHMILDHLKKMEGDDDRGSEDCGAGWGS